MKRYFRSVDEVLRSPWGAPVPTSPKAEALDRVLRSTKLDDTIYLDMRKGDDTLDEIELNAEKKLRSFPALSRDVFQSLYSLLPKRHEESALSTAARKFNGPILDQITQSEDYPTLKSVCEGRELPAYEAAFEFMARTAGSLDDLLSSLGGETGAVETLEKLENSRDWAKEELASLLERMQKNKQPNPELEQEIIRAANQTEHKQRQVDAVQKMIDTSRVKNQGAVAALVCDAIGAAAEKAEEVQSIIGAWSDDPGNLERTEVNTQLLELVRSSEVLKSISRYLGRFREIFAQGKRNGFAYGRGENYSLELGRDLSRALTSELAMLAAPQTVPFFLRKYQRGQIKQYQRREPVYKGMGDMICCLDESSSTKGDAAAWGKAVALTLLEIAAENGRSFALIHFSGAASIQTDVFRPGSYTVSDKLRAAETFLNGGTNFQTPLEESLRLMEEENFEEADIVFITDGECSLSEDYRSRLHIEQKQRKFTITGILLDKGNPGMSFSLEPFCQSIYRTSELLAEDIARKVIMDHV